MTATAELYAVFRGLLANPGRRDHMLVFADALARAYRWAAARGRWPFRCSAGRSFGGPSRQVWDWQSEIRPGDGIPDSALIPAALTMRIRLLGDGRKYGGVNRAFVLLARTLALPSEAAAEADPGQPAEPREVLA